MRRLKELGTILLLIALGGTMGCNDSFFTRPPEGELTAENFFSSEADLRLATAPLYNQTWFAFGGDPLIAIGDARAGNLHSTDDNREQFTNFSITSSNNTLTTSWNQLYTTVAHANQVIINIRNRTANIPDEVKQQYLAEARFMRGAAYTYLADLWGPVPIVTSTSALIDNPNVRRNLQEDVYQFAINDFMFAAENLLETPYQPGRVTTWSAQGMLARTYFTLSTLRGSNGSISMEEAEEARLYAQDVIENSNLSLRDRFGDLFLTSEEDDNNTIESLFALQWTYEGGWGTQNRIQAFYAPSSTVTGVGDGWGGGTGVQGWLIGLYQNNDRRRRETFMMDGDYYPELLQEEGGYTYEGGTYFGNATNVKKYIVGRPSDNEGKVASQRTGVDTYMMRLPEVFFIYARTILGNQSSTNDSEALEYFNRVRERAGLQPMSSITRDDIFEEQWREFAMEGMNWYQLVRLHNYDASAAIDFVEMQNRGYSTGYNDAGEIVIEQPEVYDPVRVTDAEFKFPYPETDLLQNDLLDEDPVPYDFSQQEGGGEDGSTD